MKQNTLKESYITEINQCMQELARIKITGVLYNDLPESIEMQSKQFIQRIEIANKFIKELEEEEKKMTEPN